MIIISITDAAAIEQRSKSGVGGKLWNARTVVVCSESALGAVIIYYYREYLCVGVRVGRAIEKRGTSQKSDGRRLPCANPKLYKNSIDERKISNNGPHKTT